MRTLADAWWGAIVASRGHVAPKASHATEILSPRSRFAFDPASAIPPRHTTIRKVAIVGPHSFLRRGVVLKGLFGLVVIIALPTSEYVAHHRMTQAEHVNHALTANVLPIGAPSGASPSSAASLEAQSAIERWFILPQRLGATVEPPTVSPIRTLRIVSGQ